MYSLFFVDKYFDAWYNSHNKNVCLYRHGNEVSMDDSIKTYKCPNCGAALTFDSKTQKLHCSHCDTAIEVEAMKAFNDTASGAEQDNARWDTANAGSDWTSGEQHDMRQYRCPTCGAELTTDETTAASVCAYCGSPVVLSDHLSGAKRPNYVIPFKIDKKAAKEALKKLYKGKFLLPRAFSQESHLEEISGIYVPFWLYSCEAQGSFSFDATRTHHYTDGDYDVTETEHFLVLRDGEAHFNKIPVDGSSKMDDSYMDAIEPFDYSALTNFKADYLPGFAAQTYDEDADTCAPRATVRVKNSTTDAIRSTCPYNTLTPRTSRINLTQNNVDYALLPVWMLTTNWHGKQYRFAINGQTGKLIGNLPVDMGRLLGLLAGITIPLGILLKLFIF